MQGPGSDDDTCDVAEHPPPYRYRTSSALVDVLSPYWTIPVEPCSYRQSPVERCSRCQISVEQPASHLYRYRYRGLHPPDVVSAALHDPRAVPRHAGLVYEAHDASFGLIPIPHRVSMSVGKT